MQTLNHPHPLHYVRFNFHESIIKPVARFLQKEGVDFIFETITTDITAEPAQDPKRVTALHTVHQDESERTIDLGPYDIVIASMGSVFSGSSRGSNTEPPSLERMEIEKDLDENWLLWLELSTKHPKFGNAYNFCTRLQESRVGYFTVTLKIPSIFDRMIEILGGDALAGSLITLKDSSWLLTLSLPRQPLFPDQPDGVRVFWGYTIYPENEGDFVKKSMLSCSGEEIMTEVLHQLDLPVEETLPQSITIPCVMPRMTAALLPRSHSDRPKVVPQGMTNMALIGQFVDIPREIVTTDYMVRGAQIAVHQLMGLERQLHKSRRGSATRKPGSG
jgi:oleate hydratase